MNRYLLSALTLSLLASVSGMAGAADTAKKEAVAATAAKVRRRAAPEKAVPELH